MAKNLVIVESPAKVRTIKKFLGPNYEVMASNGHVRDLPKSQLGIDTEHNYEPKYITIRGKGELLASLRKAAKKADKIYLATDPDREGEAISWHLLKALNLDEKSKNVKRITFNEITKNAVKESLKHARDIDLNLVDAQQTRRMLDRIVGYRISPLLWAKVKRGLSAGRVQSVALRLICDREAEIDAFIPEEYWTLDVSLEVSGEKKPLIARYAGKNGEKADIGSKEELERLEEELKGEKYTVTDVKKGERRKKAPLPFTTSTLQQEASRTLNFSTQKTMRIAQQLYEGVDVKDEGTVGIITYLRTDSVRVAKEAEEMAAEYIKEQYGDAYMAENAAPAKDSRKIQDAHEAIRPTDINRLPSRLKDSLSRDQLRLYTLIWKRFTASRMSQARYDTVQVRISAGEHRFSVSASKLVFDGFMKVYTTDEDEKEEENLLLNELTTESSLSFGSFDAKQHFTQPAPHFTEASLVRTLEELGIGRPSTYAPTITTLLTRRYIAKENRNIFVTELGEAVNKIMKSSFSSIVNKDFTANMEILLDNVGEGTLDWHTIIANFYPDLDEAVKQAEKELEHVEVRDEVSDVICEECGRNMVIKYGPHGKFLACPGFPECRNTKPYLEKIGVKCPLCGGELVVRKTRKGRRFYGCENGPECDFMSWQRPTEEKCPKCGGLMVEKGSKLQCINSECGTIIDRRADEMSDESAEE
ncbi:MAG TPA: type I DNA topoisomerase [Lachnospiraceae bacterium]|nr:type I DNA topoisomerase [Lachnospiraceae bacterium]